jgi:hypothetical protein
MIVLFFRQIVGKLFIDIKHGETDLTGSRFDLHFFDKSVKLILESFDVKFEICLALNCLGHLPAKSGYFIFETSFGYIIHFE